MKKIISVVVLAAAVFFFLGNVAAEAAKRQWIDATHMFDKQVKNLAKNVKLESKIDYAKRKKAPLPQKKEYKVGDVETFWTKNVVDDKFEQIQATLKEIGKNCYIFLQNGKSVPNSAIKKIVRKFDDTIYDVDTKTFGSEWKPGIDDDEKITLLMFDILDGFNGSGGAVGGYFFAGDEFLQSEIPDTMNIKTNEREMISLDIYPTDPTDEAYMAVVAHEFQHMIHFNHDPKETCWLNEGCSQIGPYLCGFGHADQIMSIVETPDNSLTAWNQAQMVANYGQVYLWNYYLMNRYLKGDSARTEFFVKLVDDQAQGIAGYDNALKEFNTDFQKAFTDFAITNFVNDPDLDNGQYAYDRSLGRLKFPVTETVKSFPRQIKNEVFLWSADGIKVDLDSAKESIKVEFAGAHAKFTDDKYNSFVVAAILSNSRGSAKPEISFMTITPAADNKSQSGVLEIKKSTGLDTLMIVISAQAPQGIPDEGYVQAPAMPYIIAISDSGSVVATESNGRYSRSMIADYKVAASMMNDADKKYSDILFSNMESISYEITKAIKNQLDNGSTELVDELIKAGADESSRNTFKPLFKQAIDQLKFNQSQGKDVSSELESKIKALSSY